MKGPSWQTISSGILCVCAREIETIRFTRLLPLVRASDDVSCMHQGRMHSIITATFSRISLTFVWKEEERDWEPLQRSAWIAEVRDRLRVLGCLRKHSTLQTPCYWTFLDFLCILPPFFKIMSTSDASSSLLQKLSTMVLVWTRISVSCHVLSFVFVGIYLDRQGLVTPLS